MRKPVVRIVALVAVLSAGIALFYIGWQRHRSANDIPIPFAVEGGTVDLRGQLTTIGRKQSVEVVRVTFPVGTDSETLGQDRMYLVSVPDDPAVTNVPLDQALTAAGGGPVDYFGYKYFSADATSEKQNRENTSFPLRFPGQFFASAKARTGVSSSTVVAFEQRTGVTMLPTDTSGVMLERNALYLIVVNEAQPVTMAVRQTLPNPVCGNGQTETGETCDDGNTTAGDGCSATCAVESGWTCTGQPSVCAQNPPAGSLHVDARTYPPRILLGGALNEPILNLDFSAEGEPAEVTGVQVSVNQLGAPQAVGSIELWLPDAVPGVEQPVAVATRAGCGSDSVPSEGTEGTYCAQLSAGQFVVTPGQPRQLLVRPRMNSDEVQYAVAGNFVRPTMYGMIETNANHEGMVRAKGVNSGVTYKIVTGLAGLQTGLVYLGGAVGLTNLVSMARIGSVVNGSLDTDDTPVPANQAGRAEIGRFTFHAAPNANTRAGLNTVVPSGVIFLVEAQNMRLSGTGFVMYDASDPSNTRPCSASGEATGTFFVSCINLENQSFNPWPRITSDSSATYGLRGTITSLKIDPAQPSSVRVSLDNLGSYEQTFGGGFGISGSHIHWYDMDAGWDGSGNNVGNVVSFSWMDNITVPVQSTLYSGISVCGNSRIGIGETCDDGNTTSGDGCSATCQTETGWTCTGEPSVCVPPSADLEVTGFTGPDYILNGLSYADYTIGTANNGPNDATNTELVIDASGTGFTFDPQNSDPDCHAMGVGLVRCSFPVNPVPASFTKNFVVRFIPPSPLIVGDHTMNASMYAVSPPDPNSSNNTKGLTIHVLP